MDTKKSMSVSTRVSDPQALSESSAGLLRELVAHLRQNRTQLREEWARRITRAELLTAMTEEEIFAEATAVYDNYVEALETGTFEALQAYSRRLSERIIPRGVVQTKSSESCSSCVTYSPAHCSPSTRTTSKN